MRKVAMNPTIKKKWIRALRSGRYEQANRFLMSPQGGFCCLGVLGKIQGLPDDKLCLQMTSDLPRGKNARLSRAARDRLAGMNDDGKTFEEIAAYIARHY